MRRKERKRDKKRGEEEGEKGRREKSTRRICVGRKPEERDEN